MADFGVVLVQTVDEDRVTYPPWLDPEDGEDPTRLSPRGHVLHRYARIRVEPADAPTVEFNVVLAGVQAPADAAFIGRLVTWSFGSWPAGAPIPALTSPVGGKSSRVTFPAAGTYPGHYVLVARRFQGGHVCYPFDVEPTP